MPAAPAAPVRWVQPLLVAAVTVIVFWPAVNNQFVNWDDDKNFLNNPEFRGLSAEHLRWMFSTFHLGHYHPLTWISLGFDYVLWGLHPAGYHLTNVLLHAANGVLFYLVALRLLGGRAWTAALAALLFAVHPLRVESVAWVSERRDVLSGLFFLASLLAYLRAQQQGPKARWMALSLVAFAGALLSKAIVVSLPVVLLVLDVYPFRRWRQTRTVLLEKVPYVLMAGAAAVAALALQRTGVSGFAEHVSTVPALRVGLSMYGLAFYVWKTVVPAGLYPQYVMAPELSPFDGRILLGAAAALGLTVAALVLRRRFPAGLAVWICYTVSLFPVLSIFRVDPQQYVADHHTYLATLGMALLAAGACAALPSRISTGLAVLVVLGLGGLAHRQIGFWRDPVSLWARTLAGSPDSVVAHNNLGEALTVAGSLDDAIAHFERAIQIKPGHAHAHYNLGHARQQQGRLAAAVEHFRRAIEIEPAFATAHNDLANCYARLGETDAALQHYRQALQHQPDSADTHYNLGNLLQGRQQFAEAILKYEQALRLKPSLAGAHNNWGVALDALGRPAEAIQRYRQALALDPRNADAHNNLGVSLEAWGKAEEAVIHYREALRWNPSHQDARANLARALARPNR